MVVERSTNGLLVYAQARRAAWLVVAESWDPGWAVTVDDNHAALLPADSALRAVRLTAGEHLLRFRYQPERFTLGVVLSSVSLGIALGGIGLALWHRRLPGTGRRRRPLG